MFTKYKNIYLLAIILIIAISLRFYKLADSPPGLYIDEADIGVNAYDIVTTGKDEWGVSHPLYFRSFGDYKPPGYIYMTALSMSKWGKNEFAIRFFSAFSGVLTVLVFYLFLSKLMRLENIKPAYIKTWLPLLGSFLLAISPWHIHFSRGGFEITVVVFLFLLALYLALLYYEKQRILFLILSALSFAADSYIYQSYRILAPLGCTIVFLFLFFTLPKKRKQIISLFIVMLIFISPLLLTLFSAESTARYMGTSVFPNDKSMNFLQKLYTFPMLYLKNYLSFFSFNFLFSAGDGNGRHQLPGMGLFYRWEIPFFIIGIFVILCQKKNLFFWIILILILLAPLIPAVAVPSPHSLRSLLSVLPYTVLISLGILFSLIFFRKFKFIFIPILIVFSILEIGLYLHTYYYQYPIVNAMDWGGGYKQTVQETVSLKPKFKHIVVDSNLSFAKTYFAFYAPDLPIKIVKTSWQKPSSWGNDAVLYIRPYYETKPNKNIIKQIYLPGPDKNVFSQLWKL